MLKEIDFKMGKGKSLVISLWPHLGIDRVIVENKNGIAEVHAGGHSRFEFSDKKSEPGTCDFFLANPSQRVFLKDYIESMFWGQFTFGALFELQENSAFKKEVNKEIQCLVKEFEGNASRRLNGIVKSFKAVGRKSDALLARMQTSKARAAMKKAFDSTPEELGKAALKNARKSRKRA